MTHTNRGEAVERIKVRGETVISTLRAVATERPDYVYPRRTDGFPCLYVHGDVPGCIVGHVLHRLGVPLAAMSQHEGREAFHLAWELLATSTAARQALADAQIAQDSGVAWGEAVANA